MSLLVLLTCQRCVKTKLQVNHDRRSREDIATCVRIPGLQPTAATSPHPTSPRASTTIVQAIQSRQIIQENVPHSLLESICFRSLHYLLVCILRDQDDLCLSKYAKRGPRRRCSSKCSNTAIVMQLCKMHPITNWLRLSGASLVQLCRMRGRQWRHPRLVLTLGGELTCFSSNQQWQPLQIVEVLPKEHRDQWKRTSITAQGGAWWDLGLPGRGSLPPLLPSQRRLWEDRNALRFLSSPTSSTTSDLMKLLWDRSLIDIFPGDCKYA